MYMGALLLVKLWGLGHATKIPPQKLNKIALPTRFMHLPIVVGFTQLVWLTPSVCTLRQHKPCNYPQPVICLRLLALALAGAGGKKGARFIA